MTRPENAQRIRALRIANGLTLEELAHRVGVSKETVRLWETGKGLRGPNLGKLAKEFGVHPSELFPLPSGTAPQPLSPTPDGDLYPTRATFFREHGEQLTAAEAEHLKGLRYKGDPGDLHWADELLRYRKVNARIDAVEQKLEAAKVSLRRKLEGRPEKAGTGPITLERARKVLRKHVAARGGEAVVGRRADAKSVSGSPKVLTKRRPKR